MATKRIKDLTTSITAFRTGDVIPVDGPSGTAKMGKDDLLKETAANVAPSISRAEVLGKFDCSEPADTHQVNGVYLRPTGVFSANNYHKCYYVEVLAGEKFFVSKAESVDYCRIGFSSAIPAVDGSCSLVADIRDSSVSQLVEVTSDCYLVIGVALSTTGLAIDKLITSAEYTDSKLSLKSDLKKTYVKQAATFGQGWVGTTSRQVDNPTIYNAEEPTYLYTRITSGFSAGEKIYISTKLPGDYRCGIAFYSSTARTGAYWESGEIIDKKEFVIPEGTTEIRINGFSSNPPEWFKNGTPEDLNTYGKSVDADLAFKNFVIDNSLERIRDLQYSKKFKPFTGGVVVFVFDDSKPDVDQIASLFATKGKACCFAAIPSYLNEFASQGGSILDALLTAQSNGCEILTHGLTPLKSTSTDEQVYNTMVGGKQKLVDFGFKVNGIIEIGGTGYDTFDYSRGYDYLREFYSYSDGYGKNLGMSQYYLNNRQWLTSTTSTNRAIIDDAKANNKFVLVSAHGVAITGGIGLSVLEDVVDYAISEGLEILTIKKVFDKYVDYDM